VLVGRLVWLLLVLVNLRPHYFSCSPGFGAWGPVYLLVVCMGCSTSTSNLDGPLGFLRPLRATLLLNWTLFHYMFQLKCGFISSYCYCLRLCLCGLHVVVFGFVRFTGCGCHLTWALAGGEWLPSRPCHFIPRERAPSTHWIGGCVSPRAGLDDVEKSLHPTGARTLTPRSSSQ
jgi:hypothetical protein